MMIEKIKNKMNSDEGATQTVESIIAIAFVVMIAVIIFTFWAEIAKDNTNDVKNNIGTTMDLVGAETQDAAGKIQALYP